MGFLAELIQLLRTDNDSGPGLKLECPVHGPVRVAKAWLAAEDDGVRLKGFCPRCPAIAKSEVISLG